MINMSKVTKQTTWKVCHVVGKGAFAYHAENGPYTRGAAVQEWTEFNPPYPCWVEHCDTGEVIAGDKPLNT